MSTSSIPATAFRADRPVLLRAATVLTGDPTIGDLAVGDVLLDHGRIVAVGPDLLEQAGADALVVDARGRIAIPGLVDAHVHAWEAQLRGSGPEAGFGEYLGITAFGAGPRYRPEDVAVGVHMTALTALEAGITTIVDNAHNALTPDHARAGVDGLRAAGIRGVSAIGAPFGADLPHVPAVAARVRDETRDPLLSVRLFEVNPSAAMWAFARDHGLWVSTELGPHTPDVDVVIADLHRQGLLTPDHAFNHAYDLAPSTWDLLAGSGAAVNLAPRSDAVFGLGTTRTPLAEALRRGLLPGLSGDNEVSYGLSMFAEMQTLRARYRSEGFAAERLEGADPRPGLPASALLRMATQGGADNAGLGGQVGSLTPGKQADVVLLNAEHLNLRGVADPATAVTAFAHAGNVETVFVGGQLRKWQGTLIGVDISAVHNQLAASREHLFEPVPA